MTNQMTNPRKDPSTIVLQHLAESFPSHTFEVEKKLDFFEPVYTLTVDGKKTNIRLRAELVDDVFTTFYGFDAPITEERMKKVYEEIKSIYKDAIKEYLSTI